VGEDWLETGHGGGEDLRPMIKGSSRRAPDRVSIRGVLRGADSSRSPKQRKRSKALVGWLLYCATAVGGTAAAFTVRDTLFPQLGAPTRKAVWQSSNVDTTLTTEQGSSTTHRASTTATDEVTTTVLVTTASAPPQLAAEAQTVPSVSNKGPSNSVDNRGPSGGGGGVPATGTTIASDEPSQGPGPGTTVAEDKEKGTDSSTPTSASTPGSPSTPPSSADVTSASPPTSSDGTSPNHGKGKGGGGD
jgi:hypothetical protein